MLVNLFTVLLSVKIPQGKWTLKSINRPKWVRLICCWLAWVTENINISDEFQEFHNLTSQIKAKKKFSEKYTQATMKPWIGMVTISSQTTHIEASELQCQITTTHTVLSLTVTAIVLVENWLAAREFLMNIQILDLERIRIMRIRLRGLIIFLDDFNTA